MSVKYKYITIEGNIGAGKTTLSTLLAKHLGAKLILEEFAENSFLPKFYRDKEKYAFPLEMSFMADRYKQLQQILHTKDMFSNCIISDYLFVKSKLFARVNLPDDEYNLYKSVFDIIYQNLPKPELIIYLHSPVKKLKQNIEKRGRAYEQAIEETYLEKIQQAYVTFLKSENLRTIAIDNTNLDFINDSDTFEKLIRLLDNDYNEGWQVVSI